MAGRVIRNRNLAAQLIKKHLFLKPEVTAGLDQFWAEHIGERYAIGLHLRGTDKFQEYPRPALDSVFRIVERLVRGRSLESWRAFVASDDASYLAEAVRHFGDQLVFQQVLRSTTGHALHRQVDREAWGRGPHGNLPYPPMITQPPFQIGIEAIRDALLLARSDILLAAQSNLSNFAAACDPSIICIPTDNDASLTQFHMMRAFYVRRIAELADQMKAQDRSSGPVRRTLARWQRSIAKRIPRPKA
jgi:hypothetical protein